MSAADFSIDLDVSRDLVRVRLTGFFSVEDIQRFQQELQSAHQRLDCARRGGPLTINDITGMVIQSRDVLARWSDFLADPNHRSRKLAFVVESTLARMQLERIIGTRNARVFTSPADAERWLFAEDSAPA